MRTLLQLFTITLFSIPSIHAQQGPSVEWQKVIGGSGDDIAYSVCQTSNGEFLIAGYGGSWNGDFSTNPNGDDAWVIKFDSSGNILWQNPLGGLGYEELLSIEQTTDGGFIVAGVTDSDDGSVIGNHGMTDMWVVKLDAAGTMNWQNQIGGTLSERATSIKQTNDGGYIAAGWTNSNDGDAIGNHGEEDLWVVKLDTQGSIIWQRQFGGSLNDRAFSIEQTNDGGYIVAGSTESNDGDVSGNHGNYDCWVLKLNQQGYLSWQKTLGGTNGDHANSIQQTTDGGYIVAGSSNSSDGDVSGNQGLTDVWVVKLDDTGNLSWEKSLGGSDYDGSSAIQQTTDAGYIIAGGTNSNDGDVSGNHGTGDSWVVKLDGTGNLSWQKAFGGSGVDQALDISQSSSGGFIMTGYTDSNDGDVSGNGFANSFLLSWWVLKLSQAPVGLNEYHSNEVNLFPNPNDGEFSVALPQRDQGVVRVHDVQGQLILSESFNADRLLLELGDVECGMYSLTIHGEHVNWKGRVVVR